MPNLYMLIGLPGSGKSTWANKHKEEYSYNIYSSDMYREKLLGNYQDQSNNKLVFDTLHKDILYDLSCGNNVCYDATNICRKDRRNILSKIPQSVNVFAVVICPPINKVLIQNKYRRYSVPESVIKKMLCRFELPILGEGFDAILVENFDTVYSISNIIKRMEGFDQKNPHHSFDLYNHCMSSAYIYYQDKLKNHQDINYSMLKALQIHDIGKLVTYCWDNEKQCNHYYHHENVGAYLVLGIKEFIDPLDRYKIACYINYHMEPFRLRDAKDSKIQYYKNQFDSLWDDIIEFNNCDKLGHFD